MKKIKNIIKHILNEVLYFLLLKKNPNFLFKKISGLIHIGANTGQERNEYEQYSLAVIWVEPIPEIFDQLKKNIASYQNQKAFEYLLTDVDDQEIELKSATQIKQKKILQKIKLASNLLKSGQRPEWFILEALPIIPPDLRPMIQLDG